MALLAGIVLLTMVVYAAGLHGGFIYDDTSFIIGNDSVHVATTEIRDWAAAAFSFPGDVHQGRWLTMLTFAANHYFGELDPYSWKVTNLCIHVANGLLLVVMLRALFRLRHACARETGSQSLRNGSYAAVIIAGLWLVLPINLTAVLYVSQRMESLSNAFVLIGLAWYLHARLRFWEGERGAAGLWISLLACTGIGTLFKESAVMLPLYAACIEFSITGARNRDGNPSRAVWILYASLLMVPLIVGLFWLATWLAGTETYSHAFTTGQRLLTESRVLIDYIVWTLAPSLDALNLYHDDIALSTGVLSPPSTLAAISTLLVMAVSAIVVRKRRPLFSLGIAWFLCGHLLTATIIPLLLAFEHRNYFPSIGLLLAAASLLTLEGGLKPSRTVAALVLPIFFFYGFSTWMRAQEWSDPLRLALSESGKRPRSPIAQYERAAALVAVGSVNGRPVIDDALLILEDNRNLPGAGIAYEAALIGLSERMGRPVPASWWDSLILKLQMRPPEITDAQSLQFLADCFMANECKDGLPQLARAYAAAMAHASPPASLLFSHAQFAWHLQNDTPLAEQEFRRAVKRAPRDPQAWQGLVRLLIAVGKPEQAQQSIDQMQAINSFGMFDRMLSSLRAELSARANPSGAIGSASSAAPGQTALATLHG